MKCPRCGHEMIMDSHRKYSVPMCYECGYMEGRNYGDKPAPIETNFSHLKKLNFNETVAFLSKGLGINAEKLSEWLDRLN